MFSLSGCREHVLEDPKAESIGDATDLALPPEMPILIDFHALKDILGPPMYEMEVLILMFTLVHTSFLGGCLTDWGRSRIGCFSIWSLPYSWQPAFSVLSFSAYDDNTAFQSPRPWLWPLSETQCDLPLPSGSRVRTVSLTFFLRHSACLLYVL